MCWISGTEERINSVAVAYRKIGGMAPGLYALTQVGSATGSIAERATLGWSKAFSKGSSLYHQQLGIRVSSFEMMTDICS